MSEPVLLGRVVAPLVNTNEPESQVIEVHATAYAAVAAGDVVCVLETSKGVVEVESEHTGFTGPVHVVVDQRVEAGDPICEVYDAVPPRVEGAPVAAPPAPAPMAPGGPRLSHAAARLLEQSGLDPAVLPTDRILTEADVRRAIAAAAPRGEVAPDILRAITDRSVVIVAGGGHAKSLIDLMRVGTDLEPLCIVDDGLPVGDDALGVPVAGPRNVLPVLAEHGVHLGVNGHGGLGRIRTRVMLGDLLLQAGFAMPTLVDRSAAVAPSARLSDGVQVFAGAVVWSDCELEFGAIINTGAIVSHDCRIGRYAHIAPGAVLAGHVEVGDHCLVGMAVTTRPLLRIGAGAIVGNGCVLHEDVPDGTIIAAGTIWPQ